MTFVKLFTAGRVWVFTQIDVEVRTVGGIEVLQAQGVSAVCLPDDERLTVGVMHVVFAVEVARGYDGIALGFGHCHAVLHGSRRNGKILTFHQSSADE